MQINLASLQPNFDLDARYQARTKRDLHDCPHTTHERLQTLRPITAHRISEQSQSTFHFDTTMSGVLGLLYLVPIRLITSCNNTFHHVSILITSFCQVKSYNNPLISIAHFRYPIMYKIIIFSANSGYALIFAFRSRISLKSSTRLEVSGANDYHPTNTNFGSFRVVRLAALVMGSCQSCFFGGRPSRRRQAWVRRRPRDDALQAPRRNHAAGFQDLPPPAHRQQDAMLENEAG